MPEKKITNLRLSFLCPEDWNSMKEQGSTRFCDRCNKSIKDFRNATADDLKREMKESKEPVCGHFKASQMSPSFLKYAAATALLTSTLNACTPDIEPPANTQQPIERVNESDLEFVTTGIVFYDPEEDSIAADAVIIEEEPLDPPVDESDSLNQGDDIWIGD